MKFTDAGRDMADKANNLENQRICANCIHMNPDNVCKLFRIGMGLEAEYPDGNSPIKVMRLAEICDAFKHVGLSSNGIGDQLFTR